MGGPASPRLRRTSAEELSVMGWLGVCLLVTGVIALVMLAGLEGRR